MTLCLSLLQQFQLVLVLVVISSPQSLHSHKCLEGNYVSILHSNAVIWHSRDLRKVVIRGRGKQANCNIFLPLGSLNNCSCTLCYSKTWCQHFLSFSLFSVKLSYKIWLLPKVWVHKRIQFHTIKLGLRNMDSVGILQFLFLGMISGWRDLFNQSPFKSLILPRYKLLFLGTSFYIIFK